jgi:hypothetical protein
VVIAATSAPVSSNEHNFSVIAARITAVCHSNGTDSRMVKARQYATVCSRNSRPVSITGARSDSSGPSISTISSSRMNGVSSST